MDKLGWIRKLNYLGHSIGGADKLIGLDPGELVDMAKLTTGLSDFGDESWKADFYEGVSYLDKSEDLHILGRLQLRASLLRGLRNRLFVTDKIKLQPAILNESIENPLIITGLYRTGTTHLFELLSQDPSFRAPYCFEAVSPVPPPPYTLTGGIDRKKIAQGCFEFRNDLLPELRTMHIHKYDLPEECYIIMNNVLSTKQFSYSCFDDYQSWVEGQNRDYSYHWHKKILQLLQYENPAKRWLLKCPVHMNHMELVLKYYPNARIIHTHRDPLKAIPSLISVSKVEATALMFEPETNEEEERYSYDNTLMVLEGSLRKVINQRQDGTIPEKQIFDVHMRDLISDPMTVIREAYSHLGIEFSEGFREKIQSYLDKNPRNKHGKHDYRPGKLGLIDKEIREQFLFYTDHYNIALNT